MHSGLAETAPFTVAGAAAAWTAFPSGSVRNVSALTHTALKRGSECSCKPVHSASSPRFALSGLRANILHTDPSFGACRRTSKAQGYAGCAGGSMSEGNLRWLTDPGDGLAGQFSGPPFARAGRYPGPARPAGAAHRCRLLAASSARPPRQTRHRCRVHKALRSPPPAYRR